jgi:hypothetical protein
MKISLGMCDFCLTTFENHTQKLAKSTRNFMHSVCINYIEYYTVRLLVNIHKKNTSCHLDICLKCLITVQTLDDLWRLSLGMASGAASSVTSNVASVAASSVTSNVASGAASSVTPNVASGAASSVTPNVASGAASSVTSDVGYLLKQ